MSPERPQASSGVLRLRAQAVSRAFPGPATLEGAIERMGFVQADPIRAPARAQDLLLRHRVDGYRAGDLEDRYPALPVEEDLLYAYGFLPRSAWRLLHPRAAAPPEPFELEVLSAVRDRGAMHPRDLEARFGAQRTVNAWGGYSKRSTRALERLHFRGLLRVARRENGIRVYEAAPATDAELEPEARLRCLLLVVANLLAPVTEKALLAIGAQFRRWIPEAGSHRSVVRALLAAGELEREVVDGHAYLWPLSGAGGDEPPRRVRFLAPFDPLVRDRERFEHLWGWAYRFEAYTPASRRVRGYYAMPLLWGDDMIGWANASAGAEGLDVECGFVAGRPPDPAFGRALEAEVARMEAFLCRTADAATAARAP
jgi:uncharacterized protein